MRIKFWTLVLPLLMVFLIGAMATKAQALPGNSSSCSGCHGPSQDGKMEVSPTGVVSDLGVQLDGKTRGPLKTFMGQPGEVVRLAMSVLNGADAYAVELKRLEKPGQENSLNNFLLWTEANGPENDWSQRGTTTTPYFTKDNGQNGGLLWTGAPQAYYFDLLVGLGTPLDVYDLEFAVAGLQSEEPWYGDEHFYLKIVPEPRTLVMSVLALAMGALFAWRRRRRAG